MAKTKTVSDEEIIAALMQNATIREAAQAVGLTPRAIYDRSGEKEFREAYNRAKNEVLRTAVFTLNKHLSAAADTIAEIMNDTNVSAATRLQAAQAILKTAVSLADKLQTEELFTESDFEFSLLNN